MFDLFSNVPVGNENYELNSCSGSSVCNGRTIDNMTVSSIDGLFCTKLPTILECDSIPDSRLEIPTPDIVKYHQHLSDVPIPTLREDCEIVLLIGRDVAEVHHVFEQRISPEKPGAPFAQRLGLGWVVIGEVCLSSHRPPVRTMKTYVCGSGRPSIFEPCSNKITVKHCHLDQVGADDIFVHTKNDDKPGLSLEDKEFLTLVDTHFHRDNSGHWTAPLPFRTPRIKLPNNRSEAYRRAKTFESSLKRDRLKLQHSLDFMENLLNKGYCERAPHLENEEILRVGGRLKSSQLPKGEKHPILIPGRSHTATLLVRHYHEKVHHQGRHITEGAIRTAGYWITGGKRLIANLIHSCVQCRKLGGSFSSQMMSNLPADRITPAPHFTYVGVDVFGPWNVITRRTRGGSSTSKRWAVLFTCLSIRAIHIELVEEMSSSAFINALRRFTSLRGPVKIFRSDRGTNFVGATEDLGIEAVNVEDRKFANYLHESGSVWIFNPPHSSHFGGVWERMIGVTRRILDAILLENKNKHLTHEVLSTFMAEVCAIVNARPITPVSSDPENPFILSPSVLLTHKSANSPVSMFDHLDTKDMYKAQWKCVQVLAESFWKRWRLEYLSQLQPLRIWKNRSENIKLGDLVLLRDKSVHRNEWPIGIVKKVYPSDDGLVRKCSVEVMKDGNKTEYTRPIVELVKLLE